MGQLGGLVGRAVHGVDALHQRVVGVREDLPAQLGVVAVEADDERLGDVLAAVLQELQRLDDAVGDLVTGGDATEDVHEDGLDVRVAQDDLQAVRHDLGGGATADVQEVGGLDAAVVLTGVGDDVQGAHDETRAVADDADLTVELDVVEVLLLGGRLERVGGVLVVELRVLGVAELGVLVERHLAVEGDDLTGGDLRERVDLDEEGVRLDEGVPQLDEDVHDLVRDLGRELGGLDDLAGLGLVHTVDRVDRRLGDGLRTGGRHLLDLHAALDGGDGEEGAVRTVEEVGDVVLLDDLRGGLGNHDLVDRVALDVHAEDVRRTGDGLVRGGGQLDATGLAAATDLHLRLDDGLAAEPLGDRARRLRRVDDFTGQHRYIVLGEEVPRLVLEQVHALPSLSVISRFVGCVGVPRRAT
ncbi:putative hydrolase [Streptomyces collinus Tu 365]|uniref:Putative hydrolase n=1 Tax=Streptomyces collinus (strain DSM 40733 / Tue 365) TaxID=1214242 RepID=S5UZY4_STRC3|nr:putative hydrolase [Streptomyces collinus Tu 365]